MSVSEAAGSLLEESAGEAAESGLEEVDAPGIDLTKYVKKVALSTSPNPPIPQVMEEEGTDKGGAYLFRAFKKAINALPGLGSGPNPAVLDAALGGFHKMRGGGGMSIPTPETSDESEDDEGPDFPDGMEEL